ncbi:hypothetical protein IFO70_05635 [Phormidium tenue FACHB-886]|nr:hypothetical protein [Phormidium tenue FACHB-886]
MNALPRYTPPPLPPEPSRHQVVRRRKRRNPHRAIAIETSFKLGVNGILAIVAVSALVKLIPYNLAQQSKLKEIQTEVAALEGRVDHLEADLNRQFDPQQAMSVMQAESNRVDPRQRQVRWLPPSAATAESTTPSGGSIAEVKEIQPPLNSAFYPSQPGQ